MMKYILLILFIFPATLKMAGSENFQIIHSEKTNFSLTKVWGDLEHPWSLAFLPQNEGILITERPGRLNLLLENKLIRIKGLPPISASGQGGLLDVIVDPLYTDNHYIYFSFSESDQGGSGTAVARARLSGDTLEDMKIIFRALPKSQMGIHFGSRLLFGPDRLLYITLGERGVMANAQNLANHGGSVVRIHPNGEIPSDNPFIGTSLALPEIFSYGHRNPQGMALDSDTNLIWLHEHGPKGGDEVNILKAGTNYGWPVVTYGINYNGSIISSKTQKEGIEPPVIYWVPSIAPSGMMFYSGESFPEWRGNLFVGALAGQHLRRLVVSGRKITDQEVMLHKKIGRIRDVRQGTDGSIYLLTDNAKGALYRINPLEK